MGTELSEESYDGYAHVDQLMHKDNTNPEELVEAYTTWSNTYEKRLQSLGFIGPTVAAELLAQKLKEFGFNKDVRIMDLGCGTGLVGEQLHKHGYTNIDGVDITPKMLELAKAKGIYRSLQVGSMGSEQCKDLGVSASQYDAAICVGVFTIAHSKVEGFDDLVHVVKPGGLVSFSVRELPTEYPRYGFREKMKQLSKDGKWKLVTEHSEALYLAGDGASFFVYQIL